MSLKKYVIGNWKMNPTSFKDALKTYQDIKKEIDDTRGVTTVVCPPAIYLTPLAKGNRSKKSAFGAQNIFWKTRGSYTGEITAQMVFDAGARYVIVGHSERRALGETDAELNEKIKIALATGLTPVVCIGEKTRDKEGGYLSVIENQLRSSLEGLNSKALSEIIIAYEPVWAIGASDAMVARDIYQMTILVKKVLTDLYTKSIAMNVPVVYGGSVDGENIESIMTEGNVDGVLLGRASLTAHVFGTIVKAVAKVV